MCHIGGHQLGNLCTSHCAIIVSSSYNREHTYKNDVPMNFITYFATRITQEKEESYKYCISLIFIIILFANVLGLPGNYPSLLPVTWFCFQISFFEWNDKLNAYSSYFQFH